MADREKGFYWVNYRGVEFVAWWRGDSWQMPGSSISLADGAFYAINERIERGARADPTDTGMLATIAEMVKRQTEMLDRIRIQMRYGEAAIRAHDLTKPAAQFAFPSDETVSSPIREPGFYRVKPKNEDRWVIAEWNGHEWPNWHASNYADMPDGAFSEIGECILALDRNDQVGL